MENEIVGLGDFTAEEQAAVVAALSDEAHGVDEELVGTIMSSADGNDVAQATGITSHQLKCHQGLGHAYNYDMSTFIAPSTGVIYTRVAFFDGSGHRLLLSGWANLGSGTGYGTTIHQWTWKNTTVTRSLVLWWQNSYQWSSYANCS